MSYKLIAPEHGGSNFTTWHDTVLCVCHSSAIYIHLRSVQSYFNNGLRFVRGENASQPREQTSLFRRARRPLHPNISAKVIRNDQSIGRKQERTLVKITYTCHAKTNGQERWILCRCYRFKRMCCLHNVAATFWLAVTVTLFWIIMIVNWLFR